MKKDTIATVLLTCLSLALVIGVKAQNQESETGALNRNQPNIIFYLADDQDVYDYGSYGNEKVHTPAVDRLAQEGMLFENAFTAQAICAPSRSQLFTGRYPLKNGAFANHTPTRPDISSVTKKMRNLGYEVILAGKSHVMPAVNVWPCDTGMGG